MSTTQPPQASVPDYTLRAAIAKGRMNRRAWIITVLLVIFQIINFADKAVLGLVAEPAMSELNLTASEFGFIGSSFFFLFAIAAVAVGFLAAKVQTRWILLACGISWAVLQFPMLLGGGAAMLLVTRIILGGAEGPATPISLQHVHTWFAPRERGLPSSLVAAGSTLGPIVAAPALAAVIAAPTLGWRWAFGVLGIVGLAWSVVWLIAGREGPHSHLMAGSPSAKDPNAGAQTVHGAAQPFRHGGSTEGANSANPSAKRASTSAAEEADTLGTVPLRRLLGTRMFIIAVLAGAGCFWAQGFLTTWSPKYLAAVVALTPTQVGLVSTFPWIVGAVVLLILGYASRFLMRRGVTVRWALGALFGGTLLASGVCFALLPALSGPAAVAALTLGAGLALTYPLAPTAVAFSVNSRQRAAVMAILTGAASMGGVVAPYMVGVLMDAASYRPTPPGQPVPPAMVEALTQGMNTGFWIIGIYLVIVGFGSCLMLNPDRTARALQRFRYHG